MKRKEQNSATNFNATGLRFGIAAASYNPEFADALVGHCVDALAKALMKYESLDASDVERIMRGDSLTKPTVSDLLEKEQRRATTIAPSTDAREPDVRPGLGGGPLPAPG